MPFDLQSINDNVAQIHPHGRFKRSNSQEPLKEKIYKLFRGPFDPKYDPFYEWYYFYQMNYTLRNNRIHEAVNNFKTPLEMPSLTESTPFPVPGHHRAKFHFISKVEYMIEKDPALLKPTPCNVPPGIIEQDQHGSNFLKNYFPNRFTPYSEDVSDDYR